MVVPLPAAPLALSSSQPSSFLTRDLPSVSVPARVMGNPKLPVSKSRRCNNARRVKQLVPRVLLVAGKREHPARRSG
ncbi:hypothetical protein EJ06DRAFT_527754 [Trichodelitschia bisporula]|uniref:Uncharacterized protein n=1 Tax=Trichodelitschia bisporula TaxID=703511 RepID=A0A6G1I3M0_9PEZI|nr:hypothetical protein EJ06DRAFT_527754 [Trichodelitschia bisporula]